MLNPTDRLTPNPEVVLREEFGDYAVLFHPLFNDTVATGPVGVAIWKAFDGKSDLSEIAASVGARFADRPDTVLQDVIAFSHELYRRLFVVRAPEGDQG